MQIEFIVNQGHKLSKVHPLSHLNHTFLSSDSIFIFFDTTYVNRSIEYAVSSSTCSDLLVSLTEYNSDQYFGFRILDDVVKFILGDVMVEGPFAGEDDQNQIVEFSGQRSEIFNYKIEYIDPELIFYLNDIPIYQYCLGNYSKHFHGLLQVKNATEATASMIYQEW